MGYSVLIHGILDLEANKYWYDPKGKCMDAECWSYHAYSEWRYPYQVFFDA